MNLVSVTVYKGLDSQSRVLWRVLTADWEKESAYRIGKDHREYASKSKISDKRFGLVCVELIRYKAPLICPDGQLRRA